MTASAYVPVRISSKSHRACESRTLITISFDAECRNSIGKPSGESKSAQSTVPSLLRMLRIVTWISGQAHILVMNDCERICACPDIFKVAPRLRIPYLDHHYIRCRVQELDREAI